VFLDGVLNAGVERNEGSSRRSTDESEEQPAGRSSRAGLRVANWIEEPEPQMTTLGVDANGRGT
jgi:hypothetical protein